MDTFEKNGVIVDITGNEQQRTICPSCTPTRRKQNIKDLAVNLLDGIWFCHHCGWSGSLNGGRRIEVDQIIKKKRYTKDLNRSKTITSKIMLLITLMAGEYLLIPSQNAA